MGLTAAAEMATRARSPWRALAAWIAILLACALLVDGFFVEPYAIEVTHYRLNALLHPPLKIAHLSDLHTSGLGRRERKMLAVLEAERPDVIVITGDIITGRGSYEAARPVLEKLHAPLGVWVVHGNWEVWRPKRHDHAFFESGGVHLLVNEGHALRPDVWLAGLDDPWTARARPDAALAGAPPGAFVILLFHSPFYFDYIAGSANLVLAGHTHGGQVCLPYLGPLWLPGGCGRFLEGWYEARGSRMYVSRGLGMSVLPVRFLSRPELTFLTLGP